MCACANKGENLGEVIEQGGDLIEQGGNLLDFWIFEKLVVHRALRVHHFGRVALVRGKSFACGVSALALPLSLRSHVLTFDRLRRAVALVLGDRFLLE